MIGSWFVLVQVIKFDNYLGLFKLSGSSVGGKISDILLVTTVTNCVLTIMFCPLFRIISLFYCHLTDLQLLHSKFPTVIEEKVKYLR